MKWQTDREKREFRLLIGQQGEMRQCEDGKFNDYLKQSSKASREDPIAAVFTLG